MRPGVFNLDQPQNVMDPTEITDHAGGWYLRQACSGETCVCLVSHYAPAGTRVADLSPELLELAGADVDEPLELDLDQLLRFLMWPPVAS